MPLLAVLAILAIGGYVLREQRAAASAGTFRTAPVERGDIRVTISATGTLAAISTVDVGSQISGQVTQVLADFNDRVQRGQVLARIDPSTYQAQIAQGNAQVRSAQASLATAQAALRNAQADHARKAELAARQLVARSDADLSRAALEQARAQVEAARAQISQQQASTQTSRLNLDRTVIRSPVDGVVLTRTVEPGQTVAASLQAPVLFQIAEDLSKMEIVLAIDEADIGQVEVGQGVAFSVDAFPDQQFRGRVQQVRLSATNTNNVITYPVVVAVDNPGQRLLPGMTANAEIEVSVREDVLRVPNAALRYRPADEAPPVAAAGSRGGAASLPDDLAALARTLSLTSAQQAAFDQSLAQMRERSSARQAQGPAAGGAGGGGGGSVLFGGGRGGGGPGGPGARGGGAGGGNAGAMRQRMMERLGQQFAPFRATLDAGQAARWDSGFAGLVGARRAPLYVVVDGRPQARMVRVGASDGTHTEIAGDVTAGNTVVTGSERAAP